MKIISTVIQTPFPFENNNSHTGVVTEPILGKLIGQGSTAEIFEDMNDSSALYKSMILLVTSTMKFWKWLGKNLPF